MSAHSIRSRFGDLNRLSLSVEMGGYRLKILHWICIQRRWWQNCVHSHSFFEAAYIFRGTGSFRILGQDIPVKAGDFFISKPGQPHEIIPLKKSPLGIYCWQFTFEPVGEAPSSKTGTDALLSRLATEKKWVSGETSAIAHTLELLVGEIVRKDPGYTQVCEMLAAKLLIDSARALARSPVSAEKVLLPGNDASHLRVERAIQFLQDNYARPITVDVVANHVHVSTRHLERLFHKVMMSSVMKHLTKLRIEQASKLLLTGALSAKEIAYACGFPDAHYFSTVFKRHQGLSPLQYCEKAVRREKR